MSSDTPPRRRVFVGDVQGCRAELERLLELLRFDPAADGLFPAGDLVNRGPDSLGVLRLLRALDAQPVLGNHDMHLLQVVAGLREARAGDTLEAVLAADDRDELLAWLGAQPFLRAWGDAYLVHAGLHPRWTDPVATLAGLDPLRPGPDGSFAVRARYCAADGDRPQRDDPPPGRPFRPWHAHYQADEHGGRTVVFGHWAMQGLLVRPHLRGIDTGCVWGGRLTAWIAEEDRLVHVEAGRVYAHKRR